MTFKGFGLKTKQQKQADIKKEKLKNMRTKKQKDAATNEELVSLMNSMNLPSDVQTKIELLSRKNVSKKLKSQIVKKSRKVKNTISSRAILDDFIERLDRTSENHSRYVRHVRKRALDLFTKLSPQHQRKFALGLHDLDFPHPQLFSFIESKWKPVSEYMLHRIPNSTIKHYMDIAHGSTIPTKFNFRTFVTNCDEYLKLYDSEFEDPSDF